MSAYEHADAAVLRCIARRVEDILEAAKDRESKGQSLALDIDARFRLQDTGAVQFQLASAILDLASASAPVSGSLSTSCTTRLTKATWRAWSSRMSA